MDILSLDATDQLQALARREIGARELLEASLTRCGRENAQLNAVVARDPARAFADAEAIDARRARGEDVGPLGGLPMTVKDTLDVEGLPASAGMKALLARSARDATVVARSRAAGAVIWGKTNTPVAAADWQTTNPVYGQTNNPWDVRLTPGGSSGGSAVAVASGMTALEIGADIGGSLRIPASFCGVFAHKPTFGLVPQRGLVPPPDSDAVIDLAVVGPMARSARDLRLLLSVIGDGVLPSSEPVALKQRRIAVWSKEPRFMLDGGVRSVVQSFFAKVAACGGAVETVATPVDALALLSAYMTLLCSIIGGGAPWAEQMAYRLARPAALLRGGDDPLAWPHLIRGFTASERERAEAEVVRQKIDGAMAAFFARHDVLIAPIAPTAAFAHVGGPMIRRRIAASDGQSIPYLHHYDWIALATLCGLPATAVPAGLNADGLPVGVQIIGPHGGDALTLSVAEAIEREIGGFLPPPALG